MRGCRRCAYLQQAVAQGCKLVRFVFKRRYKNPPNFPLYGCLAYLAGRAGVYLDNLPSAWVSGWQLLWVVNMHGYCWRAASPDHSSYSLHLPVAKIISLLLSSALPCPFPCTVNRRALALATRLTAAAKIHMDEQNLLLWERRNRYLFWRPPSGDEGGLWHWRWPELSPTTSHTTSDLSLLQFLSSGAWKLPLFLRSY